MRHMGRTFCRIWRSDLQVLADDGVVFQAEIGLQNRFLRSLLREKHQAFPEDKSGPEKSRRHLLSTCSGRESSGRMSRPYGAVPQSVVSPSGGSGYWPLNEKSRQKCCHLALYFVRTEVNAMYFIGQQAG